MSKPIELTHRQWNQLYLQLKKDYPLSVMLIRERMKDKLGFVNRNHREFEPLSHSCKDVVMLDFYSEKKRTFFIMKYSELLNAK